MLRLLLPLAFSFAMFLWMLPLKVHAGSEATDRAGKFLKQHEEKLRPMEIAAGLAWWNANVTGNDEDFKKKEEAQNKIDEALADKARFQEVKSLKEAGGIDEPVLARAVNLL